MANRYWIGNSGNWTDTSHWSTTSGGSGGASVPTSADDVIFNASSLTANSIVTLTTNSSAAKSFNCSAINFNLSIYKDISLSSATINMYGDFLTSKLYTNTNIFINFTTGVTANFSQPESTGTGSPPSTNYSLYAVSVSGATVNFQSKFFIFNLSMSSGTLNTNGYDGSASFVLGTGGGASTASLGASVISNANSFSVGSGVTFNAGTSSIISSGFFTGNGKTFYDVRFLTGATRNVFGGNFYHNIVIDANTVVLFESGLTQTISNIFTVGTGSSILTNGGGSNQHFISKPSGTVSVTGVTIKGSRAIGGASFFADNTSTDGGFNTGWVFAPPVPVADFSATPVSGDNDLIVTFTDLSTNGPTSWAWTFGDATTSTLQNPVKTYMTPGTYNVSLTATNGAGSNSITKTGYITVTLKQYFINLAQIEYGFGDTNFISETAVMALSSGAYGGGKGTVLTEYQILPQKDYEVRIFDHNNNFIAVLKDDNTEFSYTQAINQNASELVLKVSRSPDNRVVTYSPLLDASSNPITDENGSVITVQTTTANAVGPGTDIDLNYNVQVVAFYGGYEALLDEFSSPITDENNEIILVQTGAPNGKVVYSGYIADYELSYGKTVGVNATVVPHATEMSHYIFDTSGGNTTISYGSTVDPIQMARDAMDRYIAQGGKVTYTNLSMPLSGETAPYDFVLQTIREVQDKVVELLPTGYYQYVDPGENIQYQLKKALSAHHTFYYEQHIGEMNLRKTITQLVNQVYFVGQENSGTGIKLFKYYEDTASQASYRPGLERLSDSRVSLVTSAQILSQNRINEFKEPRYRTTLSINDTVYDIETIRLGQMVALKNFGSFVDSLLLQIVNIKKEKHVITLDLDITVPGETKRLEEIKRNLLSQEVENIPIAPT